MNIFAAAVRPVEKIKAFYVAYERRLTIGAFVAGFVWDNLTLRRADLWLENLGLIAALVLAGVVILLMNAYEAGRFRRIMSERVAGGLPFALQFVFGGLFSAFAVFYLRSASLAGGWPFLLLLAGLLVGNELFRRHYGRFTFHLAVYYIALFSYATLAVPVLVGEIGVGVFLFSGVVSVAAVGLFVYALSYVVPEIVERSRTYLLVAIGGLYVVFHLMYFTHSIPPIPLALKESGVYHAIERTASGQYRVRFEKPPWYFFWQDNDSTFRRASGEPVFAYSAVFAPTRLTTKILHRWSRFDETREKWIDQGRYGFTVQGGRDGGWRGYTVKRSIVPGKWRVDVITENEDILGRMTFRVVEASTLPQLETTFR